MGVEIEIGTLRSESPKPLLSYRMSFLFFARRSYQSRHSGICHSSWTWLNPTTGICTKGMPSPSVQKAMLTPSLAFAYWMRGSMAAPFYSAGASAGNCGELSF